MAPPLNIALPTVSAFVHTALSQRDLKLQVLQRFGVNGLDLEGNSSDSSSSSGDEDSMSLEDASSSDDSFTQFSSDILFPRTLVGIHHVSLGRLDTHTYEGDDDLDTVATGRKPRRPNQFGYEFGDFMRSSYYHKFLDPSVRQRVYIQSRDRKSAFRSHFRVPLSTIDLLTNMFITRGWEKETKRVKGDDHYIRTQLLIMGSLEHLGNRKPFKQFETHTNISSSHHESFFKKFLNCLVDNKEEWIYYPRTMQELRSVVSDYEECFLPGCGGSIDVVHCKWAACAAGDNVKATGKEGYPTLAFECITNHQLKIMGISCVQFGTRNDQHIVRLDATVSLIRRQWYKDVQWSYFDLEGNVKSSRGIYLICDGGYLRWKTLICPYQNAHCGSRQGYFSSNLETVRKDVECTFGILKKRWRILDFGLHYRNIEKCEKIFIACCILHNMMTDEITSDDRQSARIGRGTPLPGDGIFLEGPSNRAERELTGRARRLKEKTEALEWAERRDILSKHCLYSTV